MEQIVCPKCFFTFIPHQPSPAPSDSSSKINPFLCPQCGYACHAPHGIASLSISLIGAQGVGKSNYLSVLINALKHDAGKALDFALYPLGGDNTLATYEKRYYEPLFLHKQCVPNTRQEDLEPLEYSLVFSSRKAGKSCSLTFYDSCGTGYRTQHEMEENVPHLCHAQGILFLLDPSQLPVIKDRFASARLPIVEEDPVALLARTVHLLRNGTGRTDLSKKIDIPFALCITKLDIVRKMLDASSFLRGKERHILNGGFDLPDFTSCDLETRSLLEAWGGGELITQMEAQFSHCAGFGISSLGTTPGQGGKVAKLIPHRVLDPLLWILWKNKKIRIQKHK